MVLHYLDSHVSNTNKHLLSVPINLCKKAQLIKPSKTVYDERHDYKISFYTHELKLQCKVKSQVSSNSPFQGSLEKALIHKAKSLTPLNKIAL